MANGRYDYDDDEQVVRVPKKADVILKRQQEMAARQNDTISKVDASNARLEEVMAELAKAREESAAAVHRNEELYTELGGSFASLKNELKFLAAQNESIFTAVAEKLAKLESELNALKGEETAPADETAVAEAAAYEPVQTEIDYDVLADKVAERIPAPQVVADSVPVQTVVQSADVDYDVLVDRIVARLPVQETVVKAAPVNAEVDYEQLAEQVAKRIEIPAPQVVADGTPVQTEIDYDVLAQKVAERIEIPAQTAPVYEPVQVSAEIDYDMLAQKVAERIEIPAQPAVAAAEPVAVNAEVDYELIADKVVSRIPVQETVSPDYIASKVAEQLILPEIKTAEVAIDYDVLAQRVAERIDIPAPQVVADSVPVQTVVHENAEIDYEQLAELISEYMPVQETIVEQPDTVQAEIDYEELARKVAEQIVLPEAAAAVASGTEIDEEDLADRIALKIGAVQARDFDILVDDEGCSSISKEITDKLDYELIASTVAEKLRAVLDLSDSGEEPDYDDMAARISEKITVAGVNEDAIAEKAAAVLSNYLPEFDTDEIADKVAAQVISSLPAAEVDSEAISNSVAERLNERQQELDYDIVLDEDGLERVSNSVSERVSASNEERFNAVESEIAELKAIIENGVTVNDTQTQEIDYQEMASRISENITVAGVDEDAIAQKAAAVLSEYVYDTDVIAEKVADKVIESLPAVNNEEIAETVADKVVVAMPVVTTSEETPDYNIVMDEDGINEVSERVTHSTEERFDSIDREIAEIKRLLENGAYVVRQEEIAGAEACEEVYEEEPEEELVTVSDVIAEETSEEPVEEVVEEELAEEQPEEVYEEAVEETIEPEEEQVEELSEQTEEISEEPVEEVVEEVSEEPVEEPTETVNEQSEENEDDDSDEETVEEFTYEDLAGGEGGVDFANMMRYNRSFIARIIQGTDEQKTYYGEVRNALLSYKKVNSNIAWGAERFHKGRETIARFKIRGKTLIVYLALDPAAHEYSVYYHKDVSNNKSVAGTPMMIKVKSPLGVRKAIRLIDEMLAARGGEKRNIPQRDYAAMYPYETIEELIEDGLVKDVKKDNK